MTVEFVFGDKLPWACEVVKLIIKRAPGGSPHADKQQSIRKETVEKCANALFHQWAFAFGAEHILSTPTIRKHIIKQMIQFHSDVHGSKYKGTHSKRARITLWRRNHMFLFDLLKPDVDINSFDKTERIFYEAQKLPSRRGYISEQLDEEYEERVANRRRLLEEEKQLHDEKEAEIEELLHELGQSDTEPDDEPDELNTSVQSHMSTRSGKILQITINAETQTDFIQFAKPIIRSANNKVCTDQVKNTCAILSTELECSAEKARKGVKIVCKGMYDHEFYLSREESLAANAGEFIYPLTLKAMELSLRCMHDKSSTLLSVNLHHIHMHLKQQ